MQLRPLLVANFGSVVGGGEIGLRMLFEALAERGHEPILAVPGPTPLFEGIPQHSIPQDTPAAALALRALADGCDLIHTFAIRGALSAALAGSGKPLVLHALIPNPDPYDPVIAPFADLILCNSRATAARFSGFAHPRVIYNGVRRPTPPASPLPLPPGRKTIAVVGPTTARKGQLDVLPALEQVLALRHDVDVAFAGAVHGPVGLAISDRARASGGRIRLLGFVPDVANHLGAMSLVVVPSRSEGFSRVAVESLLAGTPVLATREGGLPEALEGLRDPWLPEDRGAWAARILRELDQPAHSTEELQAAGARFSPERFLEEILVHYRALVAAGGGIPRHAAPHHL